MYSSSQPANDEQEDADEGCDSLDFPDVPKVTVRPSQDAASAPGITPVVSRSDHAGAVIFEETRETLSHEKHLEPKPLSQEEVADDRTADGLKEDNKQFLPFISPPSLSSASFPVKEETPPPPTPSINRTNSEMNNVDLQDVLAAAQVAAETAERAAAAARSAASLAEVRISELTKRNSVIMKDVPDEAADNTLNPKLDHQSSSNSPLNSQEAHPFDGDVHKAGEFDVPQVGAVKFDAHFSSSKNQQHLRSVSMEDDPYFSYPNLFSSSQSSNFEAGTHLSTGNSQFSHEP